MGHLQGRALWTTRTVMHTSQVLGPALWLSRGKRSLPSLLRSKDRAARQGKPSGESWRCRGKIPGPTVAQRRQGLERGSRHTEGPPDTACASTGPPLSLAPLCPTRVRGAEREKVSP